MISDKKCIGCGEIKSCNDFVKNKQHKDGLGSYCKSCQIIKNKKYLKENSGDVNKRRRERYKKYNIKAVFSAIIQRCNSKKCRAYCSYGGRGIECRITEEELKTLWFRDKAYEMKKPSIDRIDNDGHYEFGNCRYIELGKNISERNTRYLVNPYYN